MKRNPALLLLLPLSLCFHNAWAGVAFTDPPGGWTYIFQGDAATPGEADSGFTSLDGTWSHDNGSDEWDGSILGGDLGDENRPGGVMTITDGGLTYLRIQDTGDPRDYGFDDPGSNRKIYFGHDMTLLGATEAVLDEGIVLSFRARIPTTGPLDPLHRDGQEADGVQPYPAGGDGYVTSDGGKGNFVLRQSGAGDIPGGAIAFSLTVTNDTSGGAPTPQANFSGLTMNENAGNVPAGNQVNFGMGTGTNVIAFDPTEWHEFWIVLRKDPSGVGTHQAFIYMDGSLTPQVFSVTSGTGSDYSMSYLAMGMTATPQNSALDVDFVAYKLGAVFPSGAIENLPPELANVSPGPNSLFYPAAQGISLRASTTGTNSLPAEGFRLVLNSEDVSGSLQITGEPQSRNVVYADLRANTLYQGEIVVTDQAGRASTNKLSFDTFSETNSIVMEAEDYNHSSGQFEDNPSAGAYLNALGTPEIDYSDTTEFHGDAADHTYRTSDNPSTRASTDIRRQKYVEADLQEVHVALIQTNEWLNYTRTFPAGSYAAYLRGSSTASQQIQLSRVTGDRTQPDQTTTPLGTFAVPSTGNENAYAYARLTDTSGSPAALELSGLQTLRLTALGANDNLNLNFLILVPASAGGDPEPVRIGSAAVVADSLNFTFNTVAGRSYRVEYKDSLADANWQTFTNFNNVAGATQTVSDSISGRAHRFYRVAGP
jgi:hypothetical protein